MRPHLTDRERAASLERLQVAIDQAWRELPSRPYTAAAILRRVWKPRLVARD